MGNNVGNTKLVVKCTNPVASRHAVCSIPCYIQPRLLFTHRVFLLYISCALAVCVLFVLVNVSCICYCHSQTAELYRRFKGYVTCPRTESRVMFTGHESDLGRCRHKRVPGS